MFLSPSWTSRRPISGSSAFKRVIQPDVGEVGPVYLAEDTGDVLLDSSRIVDGLYRSKSIRTDDLEDVAFGDVYPVDNKCHNFLQTSLSEDNQSLFRGSGLFQVTELQGKSYAVFSGQSSSGPHLQVSEIKYNQTGSCQSLSTGCQLELVAHSKGAVGHNLSEIQVQQVHSQSYVLTKSLQDIKFTKLNSLNECLLLYDCTSSSTSEVTSMTLSDSIPGMWGMTLSNGQVTVHEAGQMKPLWQSNIQNRDRMKRSMWYGCKFSIHPLCVLLCSEKDLFLCDTRSGRTSSKTLKNQEKILSFENMEKWLQPSEVICNMMPSPDEPLIYVTSSNYVILFDQRFCRHPVLKWRHIMEDYPCFTNLLKDGDTRYYVGCNARSKQLCQISRKCGSTSSPVYNCKTILPRLFSLSKWFKNKLKKHCKNITYEVEERFDSELIGFSILEGLGRPGKCFTLFLNKYGDIFNQSLHTQSLTKTQINIKPFKDPDKLCCNAWIHWSDNVKEMVQKEFVKTEVINLSSYLSGENEEDLWSSINGGEHDDLPPIVGCRNEPKKHEVWNVKEEVDRIRNYKRDKMKADWNPILVDNFVYSEKILCVESHTEDTDNVLCDTIPKQLQVGVSMKDLERCQDKLAVVVVDKWKKSLESDEDTQFYFNSTPFKMSSLNHISSKIKKKRHEEAAKSAQEVESISESVSTSLLDQPVSVPILRKLLRKKARRKNIAGF